MKKLIALLMVLALTLTLCACGGNNPTPSTSESPSGFLIPTRTQTAPNENIYPGTWTATKMEHNGEYATLEQILKDAGEDMKTLFLVIILQENGTSYNYNSYAGPKADTGYSKWNNISDGVKFEAGLVLSYKDTMLWMDMTSANLPGYYLCFEKTSASQEIPVALVSESTSKPTSESDSNLVDGMRPEFKEAMDSYEAFYNEYCEVLLKYKENPTNMSILAKYMELMKKLVDMDKKFKAWRNGELNNTELKYYLEVSNRIAQKLVDIAG